MANNYLQYSFRIDDLTPKEHAAFYAELDRVARLRNSDSLVGDPDAPTEGELDELDALGGTRWEFGHHAVWFCADEYGDPAAVAELIARALAAADSARVVGFTWAETCSKLRADEFSGGGVVINQHGSVYWDAASWVDDTVKADWVCRRR